MRRIGRLTLVALPAAVLGGCGGQPQPDFKPPPDLTIEAGDAGPERSRLTAPTSIPAGVVRIRLRNEGAMTHRAQLILVRGAHRPTEVAAAVRKALDGGPLAPWASFAGGVGAVEPGATTTVIQELGPGSYYVLDTGRAGPEKAAPRHFERGAIAAVRAAGRGGAAVPPATPFNVTAVDYSFRAQNLRAGTTVVRFENPGKEPHHLFAAPIRRGKTIADVRRVLRDGDGVSKSSSVLAARHAAETAILAPGKGQVTDLTLRRGNYALLCFATDRAGGRLHVAKGMITQVRVR